MPTIRAEIKKFLVTTSENLSATLAPELYPKANASRKNPMVGAVTIIELPMCGTNLRKAIISEPREENPSIKTIK